MRKFVLCLMMSVCLTCITGCGGAGKDAGHVNDPTPSGEKNTIEDMSPDAIQGMDKVGDDASK